MLDWLTALLIGTIQGLLEWLPLSSSGQTTIVMVNFLGIRPEEAISFGLALHIGTACAVFARYPKPLLSILDIRTFSSKKKFYWIATILSLGCALPVLYLLEKSFDSNLWTGVTITLFIGLALIFTGLILRRRSNKSFRNIGDGKISDYLLVGLAQGFAVLPGISRSGMTLTALLTRRFREVEALTFSFLLSVPVSLAAFAYFFVFGDMGPISVFLVGIAAFASFIFGYLSMGALLRFARSVNFSKFCIFFGCLAMCPALIQWLLG
jgi:undecaprenyl-diphosphatase